MTAPTGAIRNGPNKTFPKGSDREQRRGRAAQSVSPEKSSPVAAEGRRHRGRPSPSNKPDGRGGGPSSPVSTARDRPASREGGGRAQGNVQRSGGATGGGGGEGGKAPYPSRTKVSSVGDLRMQALCSFKQIPSAMTVSTLEDSLSSLCDGSCRSRRPRLPSSQSVRFGTVEIREYPFALGDNPSVASGPPLTIAWDHDPSSIFLLDVDAFETDKPTPRGKHEMVRPQWDREEILMATGYSRGRIQEAIRDVNRVKARRARTVRTIHLEKLEAAFESLCRKVRRAMQCGMRDADAYKAWVEGRELVLREMDAKERMAMVEMGLGVGAEAESTSDHYLGVDVSVSKDRDSRSSQTSVQEGTKNQTQEYLVPSDLQCTVPDTRLTNCQCSPSRCNHCQ